LGHTYVKATFYNALNYIQYLEGKLKLGDVKKAEVEALVDTGATFPSLPEEIITQLALPTLSEHPAETAEGAGKVELVANAIIKDRG
jgi:predicted aspartyl protease